MFNFVINYSDSEIAEFKKIGSLAEFAVSNTKEAAKIFAEGELTWCLQTYLNLSRSTQLPVKCSNKIEEDCVNIIHSDTLLNFKGKNTHFLVCLQADYPRRHWSHYHIVQNKNQIFYNTSYIPHWVQPGLIKRNAERRGVKRVAYAGQTFNKNLAGSESAWKKLLEPHEIEFITLSNESWHNLHDVDILIGIRSFDSNPWNTKPPSKLFNAWHAEIPFIGGYDSAFRQVGTPGEDYIMVKSQQEALAAILKLQEDQSFYNSMVKNGKEKALGYTEETITEVWEKILVSQIQKRYELWKKRSKYESLRFNLICNYGLFEHRSKQIIKKMIS